MSKSTRNYKVESGLNYEGQLISWRLINSHSPDPHYVQLRATGDEGPKNSTSFVSPGHFTVEAGKDCKADKHPAIRFDAENGDIVLSAPHGRIVLEARDILIKNDGVDNKTGTIEISANEKVDIKANTVEIYGTVSARLQSEKTCEIIGNGLVNIYGGFIDCIEASVSIKPSKFPTKAELGIIAQYFSQ